MRRTRFAPAPTGRLHLGHVVNAIHVWGLGAATGADVLLRVEDHDRQRSRREFEQALLDDLDWLGFVPDVHVTDEFRAGATDARQSERGSIYADAARQLAGRDLVYACTCSRRDIARHLARVDSPDAPACPGACRERGLTEGRDVTWRVRLTPGEEPFDDLLHGPQVQRLAPRHGDPAIRDRHGNWTYTFAVVVDDWLQGIDVVIRGDDLLEATGGQLQIARLVGRPAPALFAHHPLVMKNAHEKLSKADGASGIDELRAVGWTPARVIGHAAAAVGLARAGDEIAAADVRRLFPR